MTVGEEAMSTYKNKFGMRKPPEVPQRAWLALRNQIECARSRGIAFEMSPEEWWAWWQEDGRWERRGAGRDQLCMARIGDTGPYAIGNIYCTTNEENWRDAWNNGCFDGKMGRPRKLSEQDVERAKAMLAEGSVTFKEVAKRFGVCRDVLYSYLPGGRRALQVEEKP
jgi:hypothetical protein